MASTSTSRTTAPTAAPAAAPPSASDTKFDSGSGWPSFTDRDGRERRAARDPPWHGPHRGHVRRCGAHLGHVFDDGPGPRPRYCMNRGASIDRRSAQTSSRLSAARRRSEPRRRCAAGQELGVLEGEAALAGDRGDRLERRLREAVARRPSARPPWTPARSRRARAVGRPRRGTAGRSPSCDDGDARARAASQRERDRQTDRPRRRLAVGGEHRGGARRRSTTIAGGRRAGQPAGGLRRSAARPRATTASRDAAVAMPSSASATAVARRCAASRRAFCERRGGVGRQQLGLSRTARSENRFSPSGARARGRRSCGRS